MPSTRAVTYRFTYRRYALPFRSPVRTAHGAWGVREGVIVRLEREDGTVGWGEAAPIPWFGTETVDAVDAACRELGRDVDDARLDAVPASTLGCLHGALAAARRPAPAPTETAARPVAALLPAGRAALDVIEPRAEIGFRTFKWKVGVGAAADELALLDDLCARLPSGARLRLDANGAWDRRTAERWLERCAERPVEFVEQPAFAPTGEGATAVARVEDLLLGLAGDFPTPLALDESLVGPDDVTRWLGHGWPGFYVVKPTLLGDPSAALAALAQAKARVVFSSALETAVGAKAALRCAFEWSGPGFALGFGVWPLFAERRADGPATAPFIRWPDVMAINEEALWTALS